MALFVDQIVQLIDTKGQLYQHLSTCDEDMKENLLLRIAEIQKILNEALCIQETFDRIDVLMKEAQTQYGE